MSIHLFERQDKSRMPLALRWLATFVLLLLCSAMPATLAAQGRTTVLRVQVADTAGRPVPAAEVTVLRGLNAIVAGGTSDGAGLRTIVLPRGGDPLQVVVRRIGFERFDQFFHADADTVRLFVRLHAAAQVLPSVQITARQDLKRARYHVNADDIAASTRPIVDALDVVTKLRPDMMDPPGQGINVSCGLYDVWVNGRRIRLAPIDPGLAIKASQQRRAARSVANAVAGRPPRYTGTMTIPVSVQSVLATIHPEHIEEMNYVDCRDTQSNDVVRGQNAVFVVLKRGVAYAEGRGSYVMDRAALDSIAAEPPPLEAVPAYRDRLLGVYDLQTGLPVADAQVMHVATGTFARTTATGTVTLSFLPEGESTVRIRRAGYAELTVDVAISPRDTIPLTVLVTPQP